MKEKTLMAEMRVDIEKVRNIEVLEINLQLLHPPETRKVQKTSRPVLPFQGYPAPMPAKMGQQRENNYTRSNIQSLPKSANVRVNSVMVNVRTTTG